MGRENDHIKATLSKRYALTLFHRAWKVHHYQGEGFGYFLQFFTRTWQVRGSKRSSLGYLLIYFYLSTIIMHTNSLIYVIDVWSNVSLQSGYFAERLRWALLNRPFPSCRFPLFQNESWCTTFHMEINLICKRINVQVILVSIWKVVPQEVVQFETEAKGNPEMTY